jgi:hypothetical protein
MATTSIRSGGPPKPPEPIDPLAISPSDPNCKALLPQRYCAILHNQAMHTLYDSETYTVTHMLANPTADGAAPQILDPVTLVGHATPMLARHGFEIVDKRAGKEVYLDGSWAELFQQHISAWQLKTPTQEEVEDTLEQYAELAQNPVVVH